MRGTRKPASGEPLTRPLRGHPLPLGEGRVLAGENAVTAIGASST